MHARALEVLVQRGELLRRQLLQQAGELAHPLLAVRLERLLERRAVDAQEAHRRRRLLRHDLRMHSTKPHLRA